jgi:hypothetical protein
MSTQQKDREKNDHIEEQSDTPSGDGHDEAVTLQAKANELLSEGDRAIGDALSDDPQKFNRDVRQEGGE